MKKKIIPISAKLMRVLIEISQEFKGIFWPELNEKLERIDLEYNGEIPPELNKLFNISIPINKISNFELILQDNASNGKELGSFIEALPGMIEDTPDVLISRRIVFIFGDVLLSNSLLDELKKQNVEVIYVNNIIDVESIIAAYRAMDEDIYFNFLLIIQIGVDSAVTQRILEIVSEVSDGLIPLYYVGEGFTVDGWGITIQHETEIDWQDLGVTIP